MWLRIAKQLRLIKRYSCCPNLADVGRQKSVSTEADSWRCLCVKENNPLGAPSLKSPGLASCAFFLILPFVHSQAAAEVIVRSLGIFMANTVPFRQECHRYRQWRVAISVLSVASATSAVLEKAINGPCVDGVSNLRIFIGRTTTL